MLYLVIFALAVAAAVIAAGATPRFADCDPATLAIDPASVAELVGPRTAAVVAPGLMVMGSSCSWARCRGHT